MAVLEWIDKRIAEVVNDIRDDEVKRVATMLEYLAEQTTSAGAGQGLGFAAVAIRKGEHRDNYEKEGATKPPKTWPLNALQIAAVRAYLAKCYICSCSDDHLDPECSMHCNDIENAINEICDGTFLEPVAASGEGGA